MKFNDKTVSVVIGGATGIGRAVADALKQRPGHVAVASRSTGLDIADEAAVVAYFEALGPVDHVVVTAGSAAPGGKILDVSLDAAKAAFDVKFWGSILVAREAAKHLRPGGTITLTSGFLARRTVPGTFVKTAMNAGTEVITKLLAKELAPIG
jgi:NAD(P)-dependent dehydrogenase (short-subunit alcohol dehydrogenase family)